MIPLALPVLLSGCIAVAAGTGASVGYVATEDRSLQQNADDIVACTQAIQLWAQFNTKLNDDLTCHAYEGRMLVTGNVPTESWRDAAIARAWRAKNVKEVYDEIVVGPGAGFMNNAQDALTTQKLMAELLTDSDVHSNNYIITTENGVVYILGSARSAAEQQRVIDRARALSHVERVVSYIRTDANTRSATPSNAEPASSPITVEQGAPPPAGPSSAPSTMQPPRRDITVTPLN